VIDRLTTQHYQKHLSCFSVILGDADFRVSQILYGQLGERRIPRMALSTRAVALPERVSFARIPDIRPMPGLIQIQLDSFEWFKKEGLRELFDEISPIKTSPAKI